MDCKTALRLLEVCRPDGDDLGDDELASAADHLEECAECMTHFRSRQLFDARVAAATQAVAVPDHLRDRIHDRLDRFVLRRRYLRRAVWSGAAAASVLVSAGLFFLPKQFHKATILDDRRLADLASLGQDDFDAMEHVESHLSDPVAIEAWCTQQMGRLQLSGKPPMARRIGALFAIGRTTIGGRAVAVFRYRDIRGDTDVLALPRAAFVTNLQNGTQFIVETHGVVVLAWEEDETTYIALLRGWPRHHWKSLVSPSPALT